MTRGRDFTDQTMRHRISGTERDRADFAVRAASSPGRRQTGIMEIAMIKGTIRRIFSDFLMNSRLREYEEFLIFAIGCGYEVCSIPHFWCLTNRGRTQATGKTLILRHDIDTDIGTARAMWEIEGKLGIKSSYYFRLSTVDVLLMRDIEAYGGSVGYHFEELATVAKCEGLKVRKQVLEYLPRIRALFEKNLTELRDRTQLPLRFVASHGDFVNRRLGIANSVILDDAPFRERLDIELEAYDDALMRHFQSRYTDKEYPVYWSPEDPVKALEAGHSVVQVLIHPRQWCVNIKVNFWDDIRRAYDGLLYSCGIPNHIRSCGTRS